MGDHYFTGTPASADERRPLTVALAGREVTVQVAPGIFSPGGLDKDTAVLLREVPDPPERGTFLDLGCGWGPVALTLGLLSPDARVRAVDVNQRSVDLCQRNAQALGLTGITASLPDDVPDDETYTRIWSNPPIRIGKTELHALLLRWLPRLDSGGEAYLVVQKNLGSDSLQTWLAGALPAGFSTERCATSKGFRIIRVRRQSA